MDDNNDLNALDYRYDMLYIYSNIKFNATYLIDFLYRM